MAKYFLALFTLVLLCGLTACGKTLQNVEKQTVNAAVDVPVTDPVIRRLTEITSSVEIVADGEFNAGSYQFKNMLVAVQPNTRFHLSLTLPIKNASLISTAAATGSFSTTEMISINGIPVPKEIDLEEGKVSAQFDLARSMAAFFFSLLQAGSESNDLRAMIDSAQIQKATLQLREGSVLDLEGRAIAVGPKSSFTFNDVVIDHEFNYRGECTIALNFLKGCRWVGKKVNCEFDGGLANLRLIATKVNDEIVLSLDPEKPKKQVLTLQPCVFRFGKNKRSSTTSRKVDIDLKDFRWRHGQGENFSIMHMLGLMKLLHTDLDLKTDTHETLALFPDVVHAKLEITEDEKGKATHFSTTGFARAAEGQITIAKKTTRLVLFLAETVIGPVSFDKAGDLEIFLEKGVAKLKKLEWHGNKSQFSLVTAGLSTLSLPQGMLVEKSAAAGAKTHLKLPLTVRLGQATIKGGGNEVKLTDLSGEILVDVDKEVELTSKLDFSIPDSKMFGHQQADVKVRGLDLSVYQGKSKIHLRDCSVLVPEQVLVEAITKHIPTEFSFDLNKKLSENKRWRYRNATATKVSVTNFKVTQMDPKPPNIVNFDAEGDVTLDGTIEKTALIGGGGKDDDVAKPSSEDKHENKHKKDNKHDKENKQETGKKEDSDSSEVADSESHSKWQLKPWNLSGHLEGSGNVKYHFVPSGRGLKSLLEYDLTMNVPLPSDLQLDWSHVASGILKFAEKRMIVGHLRKVTVPLKYHHQLELFNKNSAMSRTFNIVQLSVKPVSTAMQVDFAAEGSF